MVLNDIASNMIDDYRQRIIDRDTPQVRAYCDGGVYGASRSDVAAAWAYRIVTQGDDGEDVVVAAGSGVIRPTSRWVTVTNNYAEYVAAVHALEAAARVCGTDVVLRLCSDSQITLGRLTQGWACNGIPDILAERGNRAASNFGRLEACLHDGHPTRAQLRLGLGKRGNPVSEHNVWCDTECRRLLADLRAKVEAE